MSEEKKQVPEVNEAAPKGKVKVMFLKSPTGAFKLAYNVGDKVSLPAAQAAELIEAKFAEKA